MEADHQVRRQLNELRGSNSLIVVIGNTLKADDGVGPLVCRELEGKVYTELIDAGTVPENYIQSVIQKKPRNLIIIDAVDFGASAGTIKIFRPDQLASVVHSTHSLSPHLFIEMIKKSIDVDVYFVGIQPAHVNFGQCPCAEVKEAAAWLIDAFCDIFCKV
ncbi:MAG: hydrogenase 3 maturation endopeptidase HyCI [Planctomycetota bacterium]